MKLRVSVSGERKVSTVWQTAHVVWTGLSDAWHENTRCSTWVTWLSLAQREERVWAGSGCGGDDSSEIWSTNTHGSSSQHEALCSAITLEPSITLKTVWLFWLSWPTYGLNRECFWHSAFSWSLINNNNHRTLFYTTFLHHTEPDKRH